MCGIAGFAGWQPDDPLGTLRLMCDTIRHRGPDEGGYLWDGAAGLGNRRLSIIDVSGGTQPITNEDGTISVVFNGEIYNYRELRRELERKGHRFRTSSDTEVLAHLYEEDGPALVGKLRGMFAVAIWDANQQRLLIARDRLGKKPLYYRTVGPGLAFGSELRVLSAAGLAGGDPDPTAVALFLAFGYVPDPYSIYRDVRKLEPGSLLLWSQEEGVRLERYWSPPTDTDSTIDEHTAVEEIRRLLTESVRYRLVSDVPVGAFLSGGIDSAAVVAEMSRQMDRPVDTYSIGFTDVRFNEAPAAAETASALRTNHHELIVTSDVETLFERVILSFDEPFADASAIPTFLVSELAATDLKVVLSGDGGDEIFGGYTRYLDYAARNVRIPSAARGLLRRAAVLLPRGALGRNRLLELSRGQDARYLGMVADPLMVEEGGVANRGTASVVEWDRLLDSAFEGTGSLDPLGSLLHVDLMSYLPGDILTKVDRMSMAVSLETRAPLLDHHMVEFACRIPTGLKVRNGRGKWIFRRAVEDRVPAAVFNRPKSGFGLPIGAWFRSELRHRVEALANEPQLLSRYVDMPAVRAVINEHLSGRRDHSSMLWKLLVLSTWLKHAGRSHSEPKVLTEIA